MLTMQQARAKARRLLGKNADVRINMRALDRDAKEGLPKGAEQRYIWRCTVKVCNLGCFGSVPYDRIEGQGDTWEEALAQAERSKAQAPYLYGPSAQAER